MTCRASSTRAISSSNADRSMRASLKISRKGSKKKKHIRECRLTFNNQHFYSTTDHVYLAASGFIMAAAATREELARDDVMFIGSQCCWSGSPICSTNTSRSYNAVPNACTTSRSSQPRLQQDIRHGTSTTRNYSDTRYPRASRPLTWFLNLGFGQSKKRLVAKLIDNRTYYVVSKKKLHYVVAAAHLHHRRNRNISCSTTLTSLLRTKASKLPLL
jgi:hypothetical protein